MLGAFILFEWQRQAGTALETARTVAVNALVAGEIAYLFSCRRIRQSSWNISGLTESRPVLFMILLVVLLQMLFTFAPFMQSLFGTTAIKPLDWAAIALFAFCFFALVELEKAFTRHMTRRSENQGR
jgi:magnesium-transporting ATPase (P-type)